MGIVINPLSGKFAPTKKDVATYVNVIANDVFYIPEHTQVLFTEEIDLEDGAEIDLHGVLVEVS